MANTCIDSVANVQAVLLFSCRFPGKLVVTNAYLVSSLYELWKGRALIEYHSVGRTKRGKFSKSSSMLIYSDMEYHKERAEHDCLLKQVILGYSNLSDKVPTTLFHLPCGYNP